MGYHCLVIARETWDTRDLLPGVVSGGTLDEGALTKRFEPEDMNALEMALQLKDREGGKVTVLSVGPSRDVDVLREALFRGVDEVVRIAVPAGVALDSGACAALLAAAIRKIGAYDLVLIGVSVPEGENSLLGAEVAARLGRDQITYVDSLVDIGGGSVLCKREIEMGSEYIRATLPAVLVLGVYLLTDDPRTPRSAKAMLKLKMKKAPITEWSAADLGVEIPSRRIEVAGYEAVPQRQIETREVDPESGAALQAMLDDVL